MGFQLSVMNESDVAVIVELTFGGLFVWHSEVVPPKQTVKMQSEYCHYSIRARPYSAHYDRTGPSFHLNFAEVADVVGQACYHGADFVPVPGAGPAIKYCGKAASMAGKTFADSGPSSKIIPYKMDQYKLPQCLHDGGMTKSDRKKRWFDIGLDEESAEYLSSEGIDTIVFGKKIVHCRKSIKIVIKGSRCKVGMTAEGEEYKLHFPGTYFLDVTTEPREADEKK